MVVLNRVWAETLSEGAVGFSDLVCYLNGMIQAENSGDLSDSLNLSVDKKCSPFLLRGSDSPSHQTCTNLI